MRSWALIASLAACGSGGSNAVATDASTDTKIIAHHDASLEVDASTTVCGHPPSTSLAATCDLRWGNGSPLYVDHLVTDSKDDTLVAGWFTGTALTIDSQTIGANGTFVALIDTSCHVQWTHTIDSSQYVQGAALLPGDRFVVATGLENGTLTTFDTSGHIVWSHVYAPTDGGTLDYGPGGVGTMTSDASGNVYIAGHVQGTIDFGGGLLGMSDEQTEFFVKLDPNGNYVFGRSFSGNAYATAIAADDAGQIWIGGVTYDDIDFDDGSMVMAGQYMVRLSASDGHFIAATSLDTPATYPDIDVFLDADRCASRVTLRYAMAPMLVLTQFNLDGTIAWSANGQWRARPFVGDGLGNVWYAGESLDADGGAGDQVLLASQGASGSRFAQTWGDTSGYSAATALGVSAASGAVIMAGLTTTTAIDFGLGPLPTTTTYAPDGDPSDAFFVRLK